MVEEKKELTFEERVYANEDDLAFAKAFRQANVSWRCIGLLFKETSLDFYRSLERQSKLDNDLLNLPTQDNDAICPMCKDVIAKAELSVAKIAQQVRDSGYEHADFKITFSISIRAHLSRLLIIQQAETLTGKTWDSNRNFNKSLFRSGHDYKEVYKWIMSPLLAKELQCPANLEGAFHINCVF